MKVAMSTAETNNQPVNGETNMDAAEEVNYADCAGAVFRIRDGVPERTPLHVSIITIGMYCDIMTLSEV